MKATQKRGHPDAWHESFLESRHENSQETRSLPESRHESCQEKGPSRRVDTKTARKRAPPGGRA